MIEALDSCVVIDLLKGKLPLFIEELSHCNPSDYIIPTIVEAELLVGVEKADKNHPNYASQLRALRKFLDTFPKANFDSVCAQKYAEVRAQLESEGQTIGRNDLIIAATCVAHDYTLATSNNSEMSRVPGLKIVHWAEVDI